MINYELLSALKNALEELDIYDHPQPGYWAAEILRDAIKQAELELNKICNDDGAS